MLRPVSGRCCVFFASKHSAQVSFFKLHRVPWNRAGTLHTGTKEDRDRCDHKSTSPDAIPWTFAPHDAPEAARSKPYTDKGPHAPARKEGATLTSLQYCTAMTKCAFPFFFL